ncbi:type VII secretion system-associated protein [Saccharopolyspora sp. NPDC002686]|uniref:type VII secretion system-associated protein n=1 Tax=Saccharopolyspora sp. NPDC002686 TaxID=3154541 RepID=UPI00331B9537
MLLTDQNWEPESPDDTVPTELVLGGWPSYPDGSWGLFRANPAYQPTTPDSPTDPVDAVLRAISRHGYGADQLLSVLEGSALEIALDDQGVAILDRAPDGVPSVLVVTSAVHRARSTAADWRGTDIREIVNALPASGVDVLLNPNSQASMRIGADALRAHLAESAMAERGEVRTET